MSFRAEPLNLSNVSMERSFKRFSSEKPTNGENVRKSSEWQKERVKSITFKST